jgi:hypothetical protein
MLNKQFTATLRKNPGKGAWTYVIWPGSVKFFGTRGVKIRGTRKRNYGTRVALYILPGRKI